MMTDKLRKLREQICDAQESLDNAKDGMMVYLRPIIRKVYGLDKVWGGFHDMYVSKDEVVVTLRDERRGGPYDNDYRIPMSVLKASDAEAAAEEWRKQQDLEKEQKRLAAIAAEYERLRKELGKPD